MYGEDEETFDQLFMDITLKWQNLTHSAPKSSGVRIDLVYAIVMTRSEEDVNEFEITSSTYCSDRCLTKKKRPKGFGAFCRRQWHEVFEPTDVWNTGTYDNEEEMTMNEGIRLMTPDEYLTKLKAEGYELLLA